jgi:hypothetical protein
MDFDRFLIRFFGTDDITMLAPERVADGVAALRLQFGFENDEDCGASCSAREKERKIW